MEINSRLIRPFIGVQSSDGEPRFWYCLQIAAIAQCSLLLLLFSLLMHCLMRLTVCKQCVCFSPFDSSQFSIGANVLQSPKGRSKRLARLGRMQRLSAGGLALSALSPALLT